ncbi:MAG: SBBP repeat-containing protein [Candidatus Cloacimonetes bacterium]|nr:SBBP repeat-containing protein [Candidatus Cloacimonadota bacterium]
MKHLYITFAFAILCFAVYSQTAPDWLWAKQAGGADNDHGSDIATDSSGNCYVTGSFKGSATFGATTLSSSKYGGIFIAKLDSNGNYLWIKNAGDNSIRGIATDSSGNCYVMGDLENTTTFGSTTLKREDHGNAAEDNSIFITKLDTNGNYQWAKKTGGSGSFYGTGIATDSSGNCYVTGGFSNTATFGTTKLTCSGEYAIYIAKLDTYGNYLWAKQAGGTSYDNSEEIALKGIATDSNGNSYVTGKFTRSATFGATTLSGSAYGEIFIAKLDANGNFLWATKTEGGRSSTVNGIATGNSGNIYLTGSLDGYDTVKFGATSLTVNQQGSSTTDLFITKLDSNGNYLWAKQAGGTGYGINDGNAITADSSGNTYVTGLFHSGAKFGAIRLDSCGNNDLFITKLDTNGNYLWAINAGGETCWDEGKGIAIDSGGNCYVTGCFQGTATIGTTSLTSSGLGDILVIKIAPDSNVHPDAGTIVKASSDQSRLAPSGVLFGQSVRSNQLVSSFQTKKVAQVTQSSIASLPVETRTRYEVISSTVSARISQIYALSQKWSALKPFSGSVKVRLLIIASGKVESAMITHNGQMDEGFLRELQALCEGWRFNVTEESDYTFTVRLRG